MFFPADQRSGHTINGEVERISLTASNGINIEHFLFKPTQKPKATIFVFQGSGTKVSSWYRNIKPLIDANYQIFMMEYRGFGASQGKSTHSLVAQDANNALKYLVCRDDVQKQNLLVLGQSYGGQIAINVAHRNPGVIDALITEGTFSSFSDEAAYSTPWIFKPVVRALFSGPYESKKLIADLNMPILIIHSTDDKIVPFSMAETLFSKASGDKEIWKIKGKHMAALIDMPQDYVSKVNTLLKSINDKKLQRTNSITRCSSFAFLAI